MAAGKPGELRVDYTRRARRVRRSWRAKQELHPGGNGGGTGADGRESRKDRKLVGTGAETGIEDWMHGLRIWVSIENIADITEFESVEQYKAGWRNSVDPRRMLSGNSR
jgi:hypothetical protein